MSNETRNPSAAFEEVTPEQASDYLNRNMVNRTVNPKRVATYSRAMQEGNWLVTHQGIAFDWNGEMVDGQHRCKAIVKSGQAQMVLVVRGLNPDVRHVIDTGSARSASHVLAMHGFARAGGVAAMGKTLILWGEGSYKSSAQRYIREVTNGEILAWAVAHPEAAEYIRTADSIRQSFPTPSVSTLAAASHVLAAVDAGDATSMFSRMRDLQLGGSGDPLFALHSRLKNTKTRNEERLATPALLALYFRTWNLLRTGARTSHLKTGQSNNGAITIPTPL